MNDAAGSVDGDHHGQGDFPLEEYSGDDVGLPHASAAAAGRKSAMPSVAAGRAPRGSHGAPRASSTSPVPPPGSKDEANKKFLAKYKLDRKGLFS